MSDIAIKFENISKQYRLGLVSTKTISHDFNRWWQMSVLRKEDPYLKIGEINDRATKGSSDYVWALRDIDFEVRKGDVVGIIGKNGAGKSTLLKILSRVTSPTTGTIKAQGRIASLLEVGTGFHPEMTGRENIYMNGSIMGMTKQEINRKLDEIIDFAGVERYIDTPTKRYSSGMTVRLGFAIAAHLDPEILVVDEVLAVGDAEFQKKAIGKMQDVSKGEGRTVLFVSHNMGSIRQLCNKSVLLSNGTTTLIGDTDFIINSYVQNSLTDAVFWKRKAPQNASASFLEACIVNKNNDLAQVVSNKEPFFVKLLILVECDNFKGTFAIEFLNQLEQSIFTSHDIDTGVSLNEKGLYEVYVQLPDIFKPGRYYLTVGSNVTGSTSLDYFKNIISFEYIDVINGGLMSQRPGMIFVPLKWEVNRK